MTSTLTPSPSPTSVTAEAPTASAFGVGQAIALYTAEADAIDKLWGAFGIVALGALTLVYKDGNVAAAPATRTAISLGFSVFAVGNRVALLRRQTLFVLLADALSTSAGDSDLSTALKAIPAKKVSRYHIAVSVGVLLAIWLPTFWPL